MAKRGSLATQFGASKRQDEITSKRQNVDKSQRQDVLASDDEKRLSLRLNGVAWRELQYLRIEQGRTVHSLLIEAVNDYLTKHDRSPVA